jgi:hypothetical protein
MKALATAVDTQTCQSIGTPSMGLDASGTDIALRKAVGMAGLQQSRYSLSHSATSPRPMDLMERIAKSDNEDPTLVPRY